MLERKTDCKLAVVIMCCNKYFIYTHVSEFASLDFVQ